MTAILDGFIGAFKLIISGDAEVYSIINLSLMVSLASTAISSLIGIPLGILLGIGTFPGKKAIVRFIYTFMSLPPVIAGLLVFLTLSRKGPLGFLSLVYSPTAMIIAQVVLITPIMAGLIHQSAEARGPQIMALAKTLGASRFRSFALLLHELRVELLSGVVAGYGRAISEVGAVMIVGGNIEGHTRVMTTSIAMLTSMGRYSQAIAMGIVLLTISFIVQALLYKFQNSGKSAATLNV